MTLPPNASARSFAESVAELDGVDPLFPLQANSVFLTLPEDVQKELRDSGWKFYTFIGAAARFVFSWDAAPERIEELVDDLKAAVMKTAGHGV